MKRNTLLNDLIRVGVVAVIRVEDTRKILKICNAMKNGRIKAIEITLTSPEPFTVIEKLAGNSSSKTIIGAGTVLTRKDAAMAIAAGADVVKVFPATSVGPRYLKDIHGPPSANQTFSNWRRLP